MTQTNKLGFVENCLAYNHAPSPTPSPTPTIRSCFPAYLASAKPILCLVGASLSAISEIATFRDNSGKDKIMSTFMAGLLIMD